MPRLPLPISSCSDARDELARHAAGFVPAEACANGPVPVPGDEIPEPWRSLLVHHDHMTTVLESHYRRPVNLSVLAQHLTPARYTRKIILTSGTPGPVIELGLVHLDFRHIPPAARQEILERRSPLGAILIRHEILRRIEPRRFFSFPLGWPGAAEWGVTLRSPAYGRLGTIFCHDQPAVEVLEIVGGDPSRP